MSVYINACTQHISGKVHRKVVTVASRGKNWFAEVGGQGRRDLRFTVFTFTSKVKIQK